MLVKGLRVTPDNKEYIKHHSNNHNDDDPGGRSGSKSNHKTIDINEAMKCDGYPLSKQLDEIDLMLQSRTNSVVQFLSHLANDASTANDRNDSSLNINGYIQSIQRQMNEYWKMTKKIRTEWDRDHLLSQQEMLLEENWDLSLRYKSLFRNYKYVTSHPKYVHSESVELSHISHPQENVLSHLNGGGSGVSNGSNGKMEADDTPSAITNGGGSGLGVPNGSDPSTVRDPSKSISVSLPVVDMEEMNTLKKEVEHWKGKYEKQRQEMHDLENQLSEYNKMVSDLKAKNDNFMRQV